MLFTFRPFTKHQRMLKFLTFLFSLLFCSYCFAQFNDSTHYRFRYAGRGSLNKTKDAKTYLFSNNTNFTISEKKIAFDASANYNYGQQNKQLTNNDFSALANLDFGKGTSALYYWALANYQTAYSLSIVYKTQAGAGIGFAVIDNPKQQLSISDGFLYEANDLQDPNLGRDVYSTVRNSLRVKYKFVIKDFITFNGADFVQPSLLSINDYILSFNNSVDLKLNKWLSINSALLYNRLNRTGRQNLLLTFGIGIDKYF